jgi:hypothetical protein
MYRKVEIAKFHYAKKELNKYKEISEATFSLTPYLEYQCSIMHELNNKLTKKLVATNSIPGDESWFFSNPTKLPI